MLYLKTKQSKTKLEKEGEIYSWREDVGEISGCESTLPKRKQFIAKEKTKFGGGTEFESGLPFSV